MRSYAKHILDFFFQDMGKKTVEIIVLLCQLAAEMTFLANNLVAVLKWLRIQGRGTKQYLSFFEKNAREQL